MKRVLIEFEEPLDLRIGQVMSVVYAVDEVDTEIEVFVDDEQVENFRVITQ